MRKQNKIVSLVLVVALLLGVFVVIPGTAVAASAANETGKVVPTITEASRPSTTNILNATQAVSGNTSYVQVSTDTISDKSADYYLVTDVESGNQYLDIRPGASFTTTGNDHTHWNWITTNSKYESGKYLVIEFDTYVESSVLYDLYFCVTSRNSAGSNKAGTSVYVREWNLPVGEWAHVTMIGDVDTNKLYIYTNGVLVKSTGNGVYNNDNTASPASGGYCQGIRVNVGARSNMKADQNFAIDNIKYTYNLDSNWLKNNIGASSLSGSGLYDANYTLPSVPALATVDGEVAYNPAQLSTMLNGHKVKNVELLRPYMGTVTVNCDATVKTNGYTAPVAGANVTLSASGNTLSYDAPFKSTMLVGDGNNATNVLNAIKDNTVVGNMLGSVGLSNLGSTFTWANGYNTLNLVTNTDDGNVYLIHNGNPNYVANDMDSYINLPGSGNFTHNASNPYYTVVEFDFARNNTIGTLNMSIMYKYGSEFAYGGVYLTTALNSLNVDEFHRITVIGDNANDKAYIYVDGVHVDTRDKGVMNGNSAKYAAGTTATFHGIRFAQDCNQTYNLDNFAFRVMQDSTLAGAITSGNLSGTGLQTTAKASYPVLAMVDGEDVATAEALSAKLTGNTAKKVELLRAYNGTVTVNCDAVIDTHGFTAPTAGNGVTVTNDGNVYTYDAPYQQSLISNLAGEHGNNTSSTKVGEVYNAIKGNHPDNIFGYFYMSNPNQLDDTKVNDQPAPKQGAYTYLSTNTVDGNTYLDLKPGDTGSNFYLTVTPSASNSGVAVKKGSENQYYVLDMDIAFYGDVSSDFGWYAVCRGTSGCFGTNVKNDANFKVAVNAAEKGVYHHFTTILDFDNDKAYTFMDGKLISTVSGGVYGGKVSQYEAGFKFEQFRVFPSNIDSFAVDNIVVRQVKDGSGAASAISAKNLDNWSESLVGKLNSGNIAPLALVDGNYVYSVASLNAALNTRKAVNVELVRDEAAAITVNCDAVINTNGLNVNLVNGNGVTSTVNGNVHTYKAPFKPSATESTTEAWKNGIIATNVSGNLVNGGSLANWDNNSVAYSTVTSLDGQVYAKMTAIAGSTSKNHFYNLGVTAQNLNFSTGYYVVELDVATEGKALEYVSVVPIITFSGSAGSADRLDAVTGFRIQNLGIEGGEWHHLTLVGDLATNTMYIYVDGKLAVTTPNGAYNANNKAAQDAKAPGTQYYMSNVRIDIPGSVAVTPGASLSYDNFAVRVDDTKGDSYDIGYNALGHLPTVATVDGKEYYSLSAIEAALAVGKNHTVSIERNVSGTAAAASTATVITNGLTNCIVGALGYNTVDNGDGTVSVILENRTADLVVTLDGKEIIRNNLPYGTDIAEYLNLNHAYIAADSGRGTISADNGTLYYGLTWSSVPVGIVAGDVTFNIISATEVTKDFIVLENGAMRNEENLIQFLTWNAGTGRNFDIVFNTDITLSESITFSLTNAYKHIYLNGHTLTFNPAKGSSHAMQADGSANVKFIGGNIIDDVRSLTQAIMFTGYNFSGSVEFIGCNIYSVANIATVRGGTVTLDNCDVTLLEVQGSNGFGLAEYYNAGYTYNKVTLNLINSNFRFVHSSGDRTAALITIKDITAWNKWGESGNADIADALAKGADKLVHAINISGCTFDNHFSASVINSTTNNVNITIDNTQFNVKSVFGSAQGNIVIGNNVLSVNKLNNLANGVVEVNSGNPLAPYLYTADYATVIWADGTVEFWADGSYPTNAKYSTANVTKVESGKTYNFGENETVDLSMKANLTLDANLKLNVYVPTATDLKALNIAGVVYEVSAAPVVKIGDAEFYHFAYAMAPNHATGVITIAATVGETTVAKTITLTDYAALVEAQYADDAKAINLVKAVLTYVAAAAKHMGTYSQGYDVTNNYADADTVAVDTAKAVNTMASLNAYLTGASLDLNAAPAWAFTIANGADISDLVIKVDGKAVEYTVADGKVIVELPAYDMLDTLTIEVDGKSGQYNFAAYYAAMSDLASGEIYNSGWQALGNIKEAIALHAITLLDAFHTYATYAAAYKA